MYQENLNETMSQFLIHLLKKTEKTSSNVSMHDIGAELGLDRDEVSRITSELMSDNLIEIKTLSGGICITDEGIRKVRNPGAGQSGSEKVSALGSSPVLSKDVKDACDLILSELKSDMNQLNLNFETLSEMLADLKTIDIQLGSPKPKTAILKECFRSIQSVLEKSGVSEKAAKIKNFISN
jgi:predicted transcriptional regulator